MDGLEQAEKIFISMLAGDIYREKEEAIELALNLIRREMAKIENVSASKLALETNVYLLPI